MTINDLELEDDIRRLHRNDTALDSLTRDGQISSLETALSVMERSARDARRRLRKIANER